MAEVDRENEVVVLPVPALDLVQIVIGERVRGELLGFIGEEKIIEHIVDVKADFNGLHDGRIIVQLMLQ